jgi:hypothetical protein
MPGRCNKWLCFWSILTLQLYIFGVYCSRVIMWSSDTWRNMLKCVSKVTFIACSVVIAIITLVKACSSDSCKRQEFREMKDLGITGAIVLVQYGPWPWQTCRKLCRQYLECLAFKVNWKNKNIFSVVWGYFRICKFKDKATETVTEWCRYASLLKCRYASNTTLKLSVVLEIAYRPSF